MNTVCAVAAVVRRSSSRSEFLAVKRPPDDDSLPNVWGLPAVSLQNGELPEHAVRRIGREKLNTEIEPVRFVGIKSTLRTNYELILMDIEALVSGAEPSVHTALTLRTRYVDQQWTSDLHLLIDAARQGSICCQVFLEKSGVDYLTPLRDDRS